MTERRIATSLIPLSFSSIHIHIHPSVHPPTHPNPPAITSPLQIPITTPYLCSSSSHTQVETSFRSGLVPSYVVVPSVVAYVDVCWSLSPFVQVVEVATALETAYGPVADVFAVAFVDAAHVQPVKVSFRILTIAILSFDRVGFETSYVIWPYRYDVRSVALDNRESYCSHVLHITNSGVHRGCNRLHAV